MVVFFRENLIKCFGIIYFWINKTPRQNQIIKYTYNIILYNIIFDKVCMFKNYLHGNILTQIINIKLFWLLLDYGWHQCSFHI